MKWLFVTMNFPPSNIGGVSVSIYNLSKELIKNNIDLKVLTTNYGISATSILTNRWLKHSDIDVLYIDTKKLRFSFGFILEGFRQINNVDAIHLSSIFYPPTLVFGIYGILRRKKVLLSVHGELSQAALNFKSWKKFPYLYIMRLIFNNKIIFRATSEIESASIKNYFRKSKIIIIPNFETFDLPLINMRVNQFIFLGRICPIKSIEKLILACSISKAFKREKFKLLIVGPVLNEFRAYFDSLIELITKVELENNILFLGNIDSPEKEILISQSKALLLVSQSENFGNVVLESLAQGTPVISSKGTPWQQLENHNCGYWIENSSEEIATKMDEFIVMSKDRYNDMSANALLLSKEFSAAKIIPMWIEFVNGSTFRKK